MNPAPSLYSYNKKVWDFEYVNKEEGAG